MQWLWQTYRDVDADGDGYVSLAEFKRYIKRTQQHVASMATSIFSSLDKVGVWDIHHIAHTR
jgi:hypothetical protein